MNRIFKPFFIFIIYMLFSTIVYSAPHVHFEVKGIEENLLKNVQSRLRVLEESYGKELSTAEIEKMFQLAPHEIRKAMEPYGYFKPLIQSHFTRKGSTWIASFHVETGPAIRIAKIDICIGGEGENDPQLQRLIQNFPLKTGQIFHAENYENAKEELFKTAGDQGYIKAFLKESKVLIDIKKYHAIVSIHFQTGPRYYFGPVAFASSPYAPDFLQRFIALNENMPFSSEKLLSLQQEMVTNYYFRQVLITPDFNNVQDCKVPLLISVNVPKARKYSLGVGYGTFTGPRITAGVSLRRIGEYGQHFDAQVKLSKILSGLGAKYYIPGKNPGMDQWVLSANFQKFKPKNGVSISENLSAGYIKKFRHLQTTINLTFLLDQYKVRRQTKQFSKLFYPSTNISYVKSDDPINPMFGRSFYFNLQGASKHILSSTSFIQAEMKGKYLFSPASFSHVILRGNLGATATQSIKRLPFSMRFFAGGLNTVRGYADGSIGPGRFLKVGSIEYQNKIYGNWNGALFYDFGVASNHFNDHVLKGEGVGLIYISMIGPIKFYIARAMSKHKKPLDFEFSIGPEF